MRVFRWLVPMVAATAALAQVGPPSFQAEDVRPQGAAKPHPLAPGQGGWIFGEGLARQPGCTVENVMDPGTYRTDLCDTRVLVGGIEARLIYVSERQINLVWPDRPWEDQMVDVQVIRDGEASEAVPAYFGIGYPLVSLADPAYAGMPVWVRVEGPYGSGRFRYPFYTEPWDMGSSWVEVRFEGEDLEPIPLPGVGVMVGSLSVGLPREVPEEYRNRIPLHVIYRLDRPGRYELRYTVYGYGRAPGERVVRQQSKWTSFEVRPSTVEQRRRFLDELAEIWTDDTVELVSNYLPSLLASDDERALRLLGRHLDHPDRVVQYYAGYALHYFDEELVRRVLPGRRALTGRVR